MYNKEDRSVANDRYRAVMNQFHKMDRDEERESAYIGTNGIFRESSRDYILQ